MLVAHAAQRHDAGGVRGGMSGVDIQAGHAKVALVAAKTFKSPQHRVKPLVRFSVAHAKHESPQAGLPAENLLPIPRYRMKQFRNAVGNNRYLPADVREHGQQIAPRGVAGRDDGIGARNRAGQDDPGGEILVRPNWSGNLNWIRSWIVTTSGRGGRSGTL